MDGKFLVENVARNSWYKCFGWNLLVENFGWKLLSGKVLVEKVKINHIFEGRSDGLKLEFKTILQ